MSKQLTVTIHVSPEAAVRAGKSSVGEHTLTLTDADLATLTAEQRDTLARHVAGERAEGEYRSTSSSSSEERHWRTPLSDYAPAVAEATLATLGTLLDARRTLMETQRAAYLARQVTRDAEIRKVLDAPRDREQAEVWVRPDGRIAGTYDEQCIGVITVEVPAEIAWIADRYHASKGTVSEYEAACAQVREERDTLKSAAVAEAFPRLLAAWEKKEAAKKAAKEAKEAAERAQTTEILQVNRPDLLEVWRAGRADPETIERVMKHWLRSELSRLLGRDALHVSMVHASRAVKFEDKEYTGPLTPEEFRSLREIEAAAAKLTLPSEVKCVNTYSYRTANEDDETSDIDADGEVRIEGTRAAKVEATVGGCEIWIGVAL